MRKNLGWLKSVKSIDGKAEKILKALLKRHKKFLIVGNDWSGKNTVAEIFAEQLKSFNKDPMILPSAEGKDLYSLAASKTWKTYTHLLHHDIPTILTITYKRDHSFEYFLPKLPQFGKYFDVVVDIRRLPGGRRLVCQIFVPSRKGLRCVYREPAFAETSLADLNAA